MNRSSIGTALLVAFFLFVARPTLSFAATTPSLGAAGTFGVLSDTFTRNIGTTTIMGDLGYTTLGGSGTHTVSGATHVADGTYNTAGTDQNAALSAVLATEPCTFNFANGAVDLAADTTHGTLGIYPPGVYCITGAASVGTGGITLSGGGTYIFRINGALNTVANSAVTLAGGASTACDVFWTPNAATTLGANSMFAGTDIDASGISIGSTVTWAGRALSFGGTVTADTDAIVVPTCATPATLRVVKLVVNANGGTAIASNFMIHIRNSGSDVPGSPLPGAAAPGTPYSLPAGTYTVSEDTNASYAQSFSGACNSGGTITLVDGETETCTIVNTDIPAPTAVVPLASPAGGGGSGGGRIVPLIGAQKIPNPLVLPGGSGSVTYDYTVWNVGGVQALTDITLTDDKCSPVTFLSGDSNGNGKLDPHETWRYSCTTTLSTTTTNTAVAIGHGDDAFHQATVATAIATVVATPTPNLPNTGLLPPLINIVKVPSRLTPFPSGGGDVTYTYTVTNPGVVSMHDVTVNDNTCGPVSFLTGDANQNNLLDPGEIWVYTCRTHVPVSTMNTATAAGNANGFTALGYAFATVLVSAPGFPNTGLPPRITLLDFAMLIVTLAFCWLIFYVLRKKAA